MWVVAILSLFLCQTFGQYNFTSNTITETTSSKGLSDVLIDSHQNTYVFGPDPTITYAKFSSTMKLLWTKNNTIQLFSARFSSDESVIYAAGSNNGYASIVKISPNDGSIIQTYQYDTNSNFSKITTCGQDYICVVGMNISGSGQKFPMIMKLYSSNLTMVWQTQLTTIITCIFSSIEYHVPFQILFALGTAAEKPSSTAQRKFIFVEYSINNGQEIVSNSWPIQTCNYLDQVQMMDTSIDDDGITYVGYSPWDPIKQSCNPAGVTVAGKLNIANLEEMIWQYKYYETVPASLDTGSDGGTYILLLNGLSNAMQIEILSSDTGDLLQTVLIDPISTMQEVGRAISVKTDLGIIAVGFNQQNSPSDLNACLTTLEFPPSPTPTATPHTTPSTSSPGTSPRPSNEPLPSGSSDSPVASLTVIFIAIAAAFCTGITIIIGIAVLVKRRKSLNSTGSIRRLDSSEMAQLLADTDSVDSEIDAKPQRKFTSVVSFDTQISMGTGGNQSRNFMRSAAHDRKQKSNEIDYSEITLGNELGRGAFGIVYKGRWRNTDCVVKQMDAEKSCDQEAVKLFLRETLNVQNIGNHPNVCTMYGVCTNPDYPICIVMEYVPGGSLEDLLYHHKIQVDAKLAIEFGMNIASGMGHLHRENILHCDLAARNLLVSQTEGKYVLKVADFGLAKITEGEVYDVSKSPTFPIRWTAPETLRDHKISRASDVWSFGVVLWEIIECQMPYPDMSNIEVVAAICDKGYRLPKPEQISVPDELYELMMLCWLVDPTERPSFNMIYRKLEDMYQEITEQPSLVQSASPTPYTKTTQYTTNNNNTQYGRDAYKPQTEHKYM